MEADRVVKVALDLDGVLANLMVELEGVAHGVFGCAVDRNHYRLGLTTAEVQRVLLYMINRDMFFELQRNRNTHHAMSSWTKLGHQLFYVTGRGEDEFSSDFEPDVRRDLRKQTYRWLHKFGYPDAHEGRVCFVSDKLAFCVEQGIHVLIDDNPELVAQDEAGQWPVGVPLVVLRDQPWNQNGYPHRIMNDFTELEQIFPQLRENVR